MNKPNTIVFTEEKCGEELWDCVSKQIALLCKAHYICTVTEEEYGIVRIDFDSAHAEWGGLYPYWLYPEEEETVIYKDEKEEKVDES